MWTCPKCGSIVDDTFDLCWQCGTSAEGVEDPNFVTADDEVPIIDPIYDPVADPSATLGVPPLISNGLGSEVMEAYQAESLVEAKFLTDQLVAEGIPAMCDTIDMQDALGTMDGNPRIYVRGVDFVQARTWLEAYEARKAERTRGEA